MNRFSRAREYTPPKSPFDMNFIGQAMAYKQSKVDANRALIQDTIDNIMSLTIDKPEARDYLYQRVEQLVNNVNSYRTSDLSNDAVARNISSYVNTAMDDTVINAYAGTMEGRKMEQYYDRLMMEDPEKYNEANKAFAMSPYYNWLRDGKAGSRLAPLQVSNYVNYTKEAEDVIKQMQKAREGGMEWQYPDPENDGYMITKKIDQMTPDEVEQAIYNSLSPGARKQMYVDGWYMANTRPESFSEEGFNGYVSTVNSGYDRKKAALTAQMAGATGERYDELRRSFDILEQRRGQFNNQARQIYSSGDRAQMGAFMVENNFLQGMSQTWSYDKSSRKMEKDPAYWEKRKYELDLKKLEVDAAYKAEQAKNAAEELRIKKSTAEADIRLKDAQAQKALKEAGGKSGAGSNMGVTFDAEAEYSEKKPGTLTQARLNTAQKAIDESTRNLINQLSKEGVESIGAWMEEAKASGDPKYDGLSDQEMFVTYFDENGGATNSYLANGSALDEYRSIVDARNEMDRPMKVLKKFDEYQSDVMSMLPEAALEYARNNPFLYVRSHGTYLADLVDFDANRPSGLSDEEVIANVVADKYLDEIYGTDIGFTTTPDPLTSFGALGIPVPRITLKEGIDIEKASTPEMAGVLNKISNILGESAKLEDVFMDTGEYGWIVKPEKKEELKTTKIIRGLIAARSSGSGSGAGFYVDSYIKHLKILGGAGAKGIANLLPGGAAIGMVADAVSRVIASNDPVSEIIKRAADPNVLAEIENENFKERTPKAKQLIKDSKEDKAEYERWVNLYVGQVEAKGYATNMGKFAESKIKAPNVIAIQEVVADDGTIGYSMYMNGDKSTAVQVNKRTLDENGIIIDDRNLLSVKDLGLKTKKVSVASEDNRNYARALSNMGIRGVATKTEIMNTLLDSHPEIMRENNVDESGSYVPTQIGQEAVVAAHGVDAFEVGLEGFTAGGVPGLRVYLYDASKGESSKVPVYQYVIDGVEYANEAVERLEICPQYYVTLGYEHCLAEYKAGRARGVNTGKRNWNNLLRVAAKTARLDGAGEQ